MYHIPVSALELYRFNINNHPMESWWNASLKLHSHCEWPRCQSVDVADFWIVSAASYFTRNLLRNAYHIRPYLGSDASWYISIECNKKWQQNILLQRSNMNVFHEQINGDSWVVQPYHGYAVSEVSMSSTYLYETNQFSIFSCLFSHHSYIYWFLPEETKCVFPTYWQKRQVNIWFPQNKSQGIQMSI